MSLVQTTVRAVAKDGHQSPARLQDLKVPHTPCAKPDLPSTSIENFSGADSGYGTQSSGSSDPPSTQRVLGLQKISTRLRFTRKPNAPIFEREPTKEERNRFCDLCVLLGPQLADILAAAKKPCQPSSAKLRIYGHNAVSSRPYIVILCDKLIVRRVRKMLEQPFNKDQIHSENDALVPSFGMLVENNLPRRISYGSCSSVAVFIDANDLEISLLGARLLCSTEDRTSTATFGGVIEVQKDGRSSFYGLTVAHIVTGGDDLGSPSDIDLPFDSNASSTEESDIDEPSSPSIREFATPATHRWNLACPRCTLMRLLCSMSSSGALPPCDQCRSEGLRCGFQGQKRAISGPSSPASSDHDVFNINKRHCKQRKLQEPISTEAAGESSISSPTLQARTRDYPHEESQFYETSSRPRWIPLGRLIYLEYQPPGQDSLPRTEARNLDWALIEVDDDSVLRSNAFLEFEGKVSCSLSSTLFTFSRLPSNPQLEILVILGKGKSYAGTMSMTPSFLLLPPSTNFVKVYTLVLTGDHDLEAGDCGAWVISSETKEAIGVVCAKDNDHDVYIMPLESIFQQIKDVVEADNIGLPVEAIFSQSARSLDKSSKARAEELTYLSHLGLEREAGRPTSEPEALLTPPPERTPQSVDYHQGSPPPVSPTGFAEEDSDRFHNISFTVQSSPAPSSWMIETAHGPGGDQELNESAVAEDEGQAAYAVRRPSTWTKANAEVNSSSTALQKPLTAAASSRDMKNMTLDHATSHSSIQTEFNLSSKALDDAMMGEIALASAATGQNSMVKSGPRFRTPSPLGSSKKHRCFYCAREFAERGRLNRHLRTHSQKRSFSCSHCQSQFFHPEDLKIHTKEHHEDRPYSCSKCGRKFSRKGSARRHENSSDCAGRPKPNKSGDDENIERGTAANPVSAGALDDVESSEGEWIIMASAEKAPVNQLITPESSFGRKNKHSMDSDPLNSDVFNILSPASTSGNPNAVFPAMGEGKIVTSTGSPESFCGDDFLPSLGFSTMNEYEPSLQTYQGVTAPEPRYSILPTIPSSSTPDLPPLLSVLPPPRRSPDLETISANALGTAYPHSSSEQPQRASSKRVMKGKGPRK